MSANYEYFHGTLDFDWNYDNDDGDDYIWYDDDDDGGGGGGGAGFRHV